MYKLL